MDPSSLKSQRWTAQMVSNAGDAEAAAIRNYWEQKLVRKALTVASGRQPIRVAYDIGAGYGRLSRVLAEFGSVVAFERDPHLVARARVLNPDIQFVQVERLTALPVETASADFAMTCTVLQHLTDATCAAVIAEIKRVVASGYVLLVEDTNPAAPDADLPHDETAFCRSRSAKTYEKLMSPWTLIESWPRRIEPTISNQHTGTGMLFASPV